MVYDIIPFVIIIISLIIIFLIIVKKIPLLSQIDIEELPTEKQAKIKEKIVLERIKRRLVSIKNSRIWQFFRFSLLLVKSKFKQGFNHLIVLDKKFREKEKGGFIDVDRESLANEINTNLIEAEELLKMNQLNQAEEKYIKVISLDNKNKEAYRGLAEIYFEKKEFEQAKEIYKHLLKIDKQDDSIYAMLGRVSLAQGNFHQAEKDYLRSLKIQQRSSTYVDLGLCYKEIGKSLEAQETFKKALEFDPNNPRTLDLLLEISIMLKDKNLAKHYWQRLKEVNPENKKLPTLEETIEKL